MKEPLWLDVSDAHTIHERVLAEHGGASGVRDATLLTSALARPQQHYAYAETPTIIQMAALYVAGIVRNHPFIDGNKRTGFVIGVLFLELNGWNFNASEEDATQAILDLAAGTIKEGQLTKWLEAQATPARKHR